MATEKLNEGVIMKALDWAYQKAVDGIPGLDSAQEMAEQYMAKGDNLKMQSSELINWQVAKAGTSGFLTGLGGIITMPVTIPTNLASVLYIQIRMIAAIAYMGGYNLQDDRVKSLVFTCMAGNEAKDILKNVGIVIGSKLTTQAIKNISGKTIVAINQRVGFRLLTKFGSKGAINLGKAVPLVGGIIGGAFDTVTTKIIANVARKAFLDSNGNIHENNQPKDNEVFEEATIVNDVDSKKTSQSELSYDDLNAFDQQLYNDIKSLRTKLYKEMNVSAWLVMTNKTLLDIVLSKPKTKSELLKIKGVGPKKFEWYGAQALHIINSRLE